MEEKDSKQLGFRAGLGIGLSIGAVILTIVLIFIYSLISQSGKILESRTLNDETRRKVKLLEGAIDTYYFDYKDEPITDEKLQKGVLDGMIAALNDPYSEYYDAEELKKMQADNEGVYYGIGAYISIDEIGYPEISGVMEDTPAERAGIHAGDLIYLVDDESTYGLTLQEVVKRVKGEEGTTVHLTIVREGEDDYLEFDVVRGKVANITVKHSMLEDNIGYILIQEFDTVTIDQFREAYQDILSQNAKGLIIDLRGNGGGLLNSVLEITRQFLPEGLIVYTENKNGQRNEYGCDGANKIEIPLVVLINQYSASASEILAGAVKDHEIGKLVGITSYGKGIVQDTHTLSDGSAIKLTERAYYTPNGNYIQGKGIEPDVEIEFDAGKYYDEGIDVQLNKAIEVVKGEK